MITPDKKQAPRHYIEIPSDIDKLTDAQIEAWAEKAYEHLAPMLKDGDIKEENGDRG